MKRTMPDWIYRHLLFAELDQPQLAQVVTAALPVQLDAGEELFTHGQRATRFFILETGTIQLYRLSPAGEEKVIELIWPGQSFAEAVMFMEGNRYPVSARAIVPSEVWGFDMNVFRAVLQNSPAVCFRLLGRMSQRLRQLLQEIDELTLQNATMRLAQYLLRFAPEPSCGRYSVHWETPKQVLASRLSVRPETFSRILQQLAQAGIIQVHGKTVEVLDAARLRNWAGQSD